MTEDNVAKSRKESGSKVDDTIHPVPSHGQGETEPTGDKALNDRVVDDAARYLASATHFGPLTPEREKKLRKKIDAWMIPLVRLPRGALQARLLTDTVSTQLLFTATLGAVDKVEIGTASLYGFQEDNHMVGQEYSWLGSILPLGVRDNVPLSLWRVALTVL